MNKVAYLQGYMHEDSFIGKVKKGLEEFGEKVYDVYDTVSTLGDSDKMQDKIKDTAVATAKNPGLQNVFQGYISKAVDPYIKDMKNTAKNYAGMLGAGYLGTNLLNNMSANRRHKELLEAIKGRYGNRNLSIAQPTMQAYRLRNTRSRA